MRTEIQPYTRYERAASIIAAFILGALIALAFFFGLRASVDHELDAHSAGAFPEYLEENR